ncbi:MAG: hypothetical protein JKY51_06975 [Opitutaceae bacterium]|nr:hypothetical protein [Opitutaceae bacterium]
MGAKPLGLTMLVIAEIMNRYEAFMHNRNLKRKEKIVFQEIDVNKCKATTKKGTICKKNAVRILNGGVIDGYCTIHSELNSASKLPGD